MRTLAAILLLPILVFEGVIVAFIVAIATVQMKFSDIRESGTIPKLFE